MASGLGAVVTYALLTGLWGTILVLYVRHRRAARGDALITLLLSVLTLDAFKTVVESAYFGLLWGANYGLLSETFKVLAQPVFLTLIKLLNVVVAVVVLGWLVRFWVPTELARRASQRQSEERLRRELEASLRAAHESEERFRLAASASHDFVWDFDLRTGAVYTPPRFAELLGYTVAEWPLTSGLWLGVVHPDDSKRVTEAIRRVTSGETAIYDVKHRAVRKDGTVLHLHATGVTVRDEAGKAVRFVGFARDISAALAAEAAHVQTQKLESLGLLAGGIAHDFNNLLTVLSASLSLAERQAEKGESVKDVLGTATLALTRATILTRQLLAYAGRAGLSKQALDLNAVVSSMGELLTVSIPRKVRLERALQDGLPAVLGDEGQLQQVVMNLITNAAEAIGDREGTVTLRTEAQTLETPPPEVIGSAPRGRVVCLTVSDTGLGISPDVKARLFDPFFSTKGSGRGLGLAALQGILRSHGGAIGLTSELGKGTTFSVYLPAMFGVAPAPRAAVISPEKTSPVHARVLVVDDEPLLRRSARRVLQELGCTVAEATTGVEAVAKVRAGLDQFDLVLMDLTMPEMDGYEATRLIAELAPSLTVVLSSGYSAVDAPDSLPRGMRMLPKPYDLAMLEKLLREVMADR